MHLFDSQKYLLTFSGGYFLFDMLLLIYNGSRNDPNHKEMLIHRLMSIGMISIAIFVGGFFGSVTQLTLVTEVVTPIIVMRSIMALHGWSDSILFFFNKMVLTAAFFVFRIMFYYYMVFGKIVDYAGYRHHSFWTNIPIEFHKLCYL